MAFMFNPEAGKAVDLEVVPKAEDTKQAQRAKEVDEHIQALVTQVVSGGLELCRLCHQMLDERLFLLLGFETYPAWAASVRELERSTAYEYAKAGNALHNLSEHSDFKLVTNENQLKPLLRLPEPKQAAVLTKAAKLAKLEPKGGGITRGIMAKARKLLFPPAKPKGATGGTRDTDTGWAWFNPEGQLLWDTARASKQVSNDIVQRSRGETLDALRKQGYRGYRIKVVPVGEEGNDAPAKPEQSQKPAPKKKPEQKPAPKQKSAEPPESLVKHAEVVRAIRRCLATGGYFGRVPSTRIGLLTLLDNGELRPEYWVRAWEQSSRQWTLGVFAKKTVFRVLSDLRKAGEVETDKCGSTNALNWKDRLTEKGLAAKKTDDAEQLPGSRPPKKEPEPKPVPEPDADAPAMNLLTGKKLLTVIKRLLKPYDWCTPGGLLTHVAQHADTDGDTISPRQYQAVLQALKDLELAGEVSVDKVGEPGAWKYRLAAKKSDDAEKAEQERQRRQPAQEPAPKQKPEQKAKAEPEPEPDEPEYDGPTAESVLTPVVERLDEIAAGIEEQVANMPESMQGGEKADALGEVQGAVTEVKDSLESFVEGLMESGLGETPVKGVPKLVGGSRGKQARRCEEIMHKVADLLPAKDADGEELAINLRDIAEELNNVEFP